MVISPTVTSVPYCGASDEAAAIDFVSGEYKNGIGMMPQNRRQRDFGVNETAGVSAGSSAAEPTFSP